MTARQERTPEAAGVPARRAALRLLDAVLRRGQPLESALASATGGLTRGDDRAFAHAIAAETLRRLVDLDALIDSATQRNLPDDAKARMALRIALVQALAMDTPPHAAISTALPLVDGGPRKLVHGVFGTLMRSEAVLPDVPTLPAATALRWEAAWGGETVAAAERAFAVPPPLDLTLADASATGDWCERLGGTSLVPGHIRLASHGAVGELPGYEEGAWWVQDLAASLPARLIGAGAGTALDLCAAPGGKTLQLASAGWETTAIDASESRLARLRENLDRAGKPAHVITADLLTWRPPAPVDAILLDAPCSASGIFRRHPDVVHRVRPSLIGEMAALQAQILARAADWVRPGGLLLYATCSLEPQEGEAQIEALLANRDDFSIEPPRAGELPAGIEPSGPGWVRTLPGMLEAVGGCDGFFVARLRRSG